MFYNIRTDLDKLQCASNITKIVNEVTTENQNTYRVLQLYLNTLYTISETEKNLSLVSSTFALRLLSIIGYKPIIEECQNCKTKEDLNYFSFKDNGLKCKNCAKLDKGAIEITDTTRDAIRYIILADPKKLFFFNVPEESIKELQIISKIYLQEKLEKEFKL
jgi:DNA repair protein RecO (recombination protein O)